MPTCLDLATFLCNLPSDLRQWLLTQPPQLLVTTLGLWPNAGQKQYRIKYLQGLKNSTEDYRQFCYRIQAIPDEEFMTMLRGLSNDTGTGS